MVFCRRCDIVNRATARITVFRTVVLSVQMRTALFLERTSTGYQADGKKDHDDRENDDRQENGCEHTYFSI